MAREGRHEQDTAVKLELGCGCGQDCAPSNSNPLFYLHYTPVLPITLLPFMPIPESPKASQSDIAVPHWLTLMRWPTSACVPVLQHTMPCAKHPPSPLHLH